MLIENDPQNPAENTAPEPEITATPESVVTGTPEQEAEKAPKTFTQEEMDAAIGKRLAKERRSWDRQQATRAIDAPKPVSDEPISPEMFESYEAYAEALAVRKADELIRQRDVQRQRTEIDSTYADREEEARIKYDDFEQVVHNPNLHVTNEMVEVIKASEIGPDLAYWLGSNPKEADRIARLSPLQQAREIGKIEAKIASDPPAKKTTSAPAPINPITARNSTNPIYDTTDPRSTKTMSDSQWIDAERQRLIRKAQSQQNR